MATPRIHQQQQGAAPGGLGEGADSGIRSHQARGALSNHGLVLIPKQSLDAGVTLPTLPLGKLRLRETK